LAVVTVVLELLVALDAATVVTFAVVDDVVVFVAVEEADGKALVLIHPVTYVPAGVFPT
jgi:hypothetical protein